MQRGIRRPVKVEILLIASLLVMTLCPTTVTAYHLPADTIEDLSGLKVAVYYGTELDTVVASRVALVNMYEWMNATVDVLNATDIQNGALDNDYEILALPGGNPITYGSDLGMDGMDRIREFVRYGGSYFGICGGAMLACRVVTFSGSSSYYQLKLFNGTVMGPIGGVDGMTEGQVNTSCVNPDLSGLTESFNTLYLGGGYYVPDEGQEMACLATYDINSQPMMIVSTFDHGSVFLSAVHPEIEENSDRDGTSHLDDYDDLDSEWDLMLKVSIWQIEASTWVTPPETTTTTTQTSTSITTSTTPVDGSMDALLPVIAVSGVLVVTVLLVILAKRR